MYWIDIVTIVVALVLIYKSYHHGLLSSAFRIIGLILGIIIAANLGAWASDMLSLTLNLSRQISDIVGYILIFLIVILLAQVAGHFLKTIIHTIKLGWLDRAGGILFGALKAAIIMSLIFWLLLAIPSDTLGRDMQEKSFTYRMLGGFAPSLYEKLVQPYLREGNTRDRLDSLLSPQSDLLNLGSDFEDQLSGIEGADTAFIEEMKARFKEAPLSKQLEVMKELSSGAPDLQKIIHTLYSETP